MMYRLGRLWGNGVFHRRHISLLLKRSSRLFMNSRLQGLRGGPCGRVPEAQPSPPPGPGSQSPGSETPTWTVPSPPVCCPGRTGDRRPGVPGRWADTAAGGPFRPRLLRGSGEGWGFHAGLGTGISSCLASPRPISESPCCSYGTSASGSRPQLGVRHKVKGRQTPSRAAPCTGSGGQNAGPGCSGPSSFPSTAPGPGPPRQLSFRQVGTGVSLGWGRGTLGPCCGPGGPGSRGGSGGSRQQRTGAHFLSQGVRYAR